MKRRAWLLYLVAGSVGLATWEFVPALKTGPVFNAIALSSPIAMLVAVRMWRPTPRGPWYLFALGQTFFVIGDVITYNYATFFGGAELPFPSVGDVAYLLVYPCLVTGILWLIHSRSPGRDRESLIDSLIVAIGVGVVSWVFLMAPTAHDTGSTLLQKVVGMAYPLMDLVLLGVVIRLLIGGGRRGLTFYLLPAAALTLFVTDFIYSYISVQGITYDQSGYLEAGWGAFYLLWGAAALHPSMRRLSERAPEHGSRITRGRLLLIGAAALIPQGVRAIQLIRGAATDLWVITLSTTALFILVVIRMAGLVHKLELSFGRERALRRAGASLVTATNREGIYRAAMEAVETLAADAHARLLVHLDEDEADHYTVAAATAGAEGLVGRRVQLPLADEARAALLTKRATDALDIVELRSVLGLPAEITYALAIPLFLRGAPNGLLVVASAEKLHATTRDGLDALCSQVALALESAALTEDLLRRQSEARFSSLVQNSSDVVMVVDADSSVKWVSPSIERVLGYAPEEVGGSKLTALVHPEDKTAILQFLMEASRGGAAHAVTEFRIRHREGFWLHVETLRTNLLHDPNVRGIVLNTRDVSERKAFEEQLAHQAFHDPITGLANRALFRDRVEHALERQLRDGHPVSVLFMDLDDFKTINDSLGHAAGDHMLAEVGERLRTCLRAADTAARLGGDEFAILLEDGGEELGAADVAVRILRSLEAPFHLEGKEVFCRASIGIATADAGGDGHRVGAEELLRNADVAMYMAKEAGKNRYQIFEPAMHDVALKRLELKADLQRALDNGEFVLHYQPVIELATGEVSGFEALLRWQHPQRGLVPPMEFIPLAEETGLIVQIGNWVLQEATRQGKALQEQYPMDPPLHVAVNLSARQLQRPEIVSDVAHALVRSGLAPESLVLEITESIMMQDVDLSLQRLRELKELGVKLAVDDFGTGYSSLNYIQQFPVDILKVDKSFIDAFNTDERKSALTATIIKLAEDLELRPVAEGIERADQLEQLLRLRCDLGQGYYFARPMPPEGIDDLLETRRALATRDAELSG
jgi:diguanylate cyclase (GGDEF)-like protein/PAS domain S-box-containing protein